MKFGYEIKPCLYVLGVERVDDGSTEATTIHTAVSAAVL